LVNAGAELSPGDYADLLYAARCVRAGTAKLSIGSEDAARLVFALFEARAEIAVLKGKVRVVGKKVGKV